MNPLTSFLNRSPLLARVAPFICFVLLTFAQESFGQTGRYWFYLAKSVVAAWMLWAAWPLVLEMRWKLSWEAVVVGVGIFVVWVGLEPFVPGQQQLWVKLGLSKAPATPSPAWNPFQHFGDGAMLAWFFVVVRVVGSSIVVPPLEEVFYRSFLYRWIVRPNFESVSLGLFAWKPFLMTALIFGFAHNEWLAGILCAAAYQGLVCWKGRLGDAMTAHAVTNFLLGLWVVWRGAWQFW